MSMTPEAKRELSATIRALRSRLLANLHDAAESAYRFGAPLHDAGLSEASRARRKRLVQWIEEQERAEAGRGQAKRTRDDMRRDAEKQAAYTLLNRVLFLRLLEAAGLQKPAVVTGGWESPGYKDFRSLAPELVRGDETEGYGFLLRLVFEDLAAELPGLYGPAGIAELIPVPAATLRHVVEALDAPGLASCWTDDMTLGWVYQYWNDPEREALDAKLNAGGKLAAHEIASKTQMFTERYMVDWLLQNSLGPMWLAICQKHGWTAEVKADGTLDRLEQRRVEWRAKRESGEVALTDLMPLHTDAERRWAYYLPQPIPDDAVEHALESIRDLKAIDPAVGSGHFLVVLFDLLLALYLEEARHRGEADQPRWSVRSVVENILENNLHGIDLDPRAVQIAAAALWLKAKQACPEATPERLNLVASNLRLGGLPDDDPALVELRREVERETGIPAALTDAVVHALRDADHLGSLLKIDTAVDEAIRQHEATYGLTSDSVQGRLFGGAPPAQQRLALDRDTARASVLGRLESFLAGHSAGDDLGLRLRGEQLAAGVRFVRLIREGTYHLVVGNPPYQGTAKMQDTNYVAQNYPRGKADLYAAFLERGLELVKPAGTSALLTMRSWMFINQYSEIRLWLLGSFELRALGDFAIGAFDEVPNDILSVVVSVFRRFVPSKLKSVALQPTSPNDSSYDRERTRRKKAAVLSHVGLLEFSTAELQLIPDSPVVYWWEPPFLTHYINSPKLGSSYPGLVGLRTSDNNRFLRAAWECCRTSLWLKSFNEPSMSPEPRTKHFVPYIKGARGRTWFEEVTDVAAWHNEGLEYLVCFERKYKGFTSIQNRRHYFMPGIAFSMIGSSFTARAHRYRSILGHKGSSVFPHSISEVLCLLNASVSRMILSSLNPGIGFEVGDVNRLPLLDISGSAEIYAALKSSFSDHESCREPSVEFRQPGPSSWQSCQSWAQAAIDRAQGSPLPSYEPEYEPEPVTDHLSFALGVALGRFDPEGEGALNPSEDCVVQSLPSGILFLRLLAEPAWRLVASRGS